MDETYSDILPVRKKNGDHRAYISVMRGCNNMCSFCIVPFTRGRERSRPLDSIIEEVKKLRDEGVKVVPSQQEITLLGQNVNSYHDISGTSGLPHMNSSIGFKELYKLRDQPGFRFADLLDAVANTAPEIRFRFTSPHPKDFPLPVLQAINSHNNICKQIHIPAQSGNSRVLQSMRRNYTREAYLDLIGTIRSTIPGVALSSDFIAGFCGETEAEFQDTLSLIETVKYDFVKSTNAGLYVRLLDERKNPRASIDD